MNKLASLQATNLRHHHSEQGVGCDIERHTEEGVGTTLVEHTREFAIRHIELEERVTRRQSHLLDIRNIPRRNDNSTRVGALGNQIDRLLNLVDSLAIRAWPRAPLIAIYMVQIAELIPLNRRVDTLLCCTQELLHSNRQNARLHAQLVVVAVGVVIPNMYAIINEIFDIGVTIEEPQKFVNNALQKDLLGGQQREALGEVEAHLVSEHRFCTCTCAVGLNNTLVLDTG